MSKNVSFSMNTGAGGGRDIILEMVKPAVLASAEAIADRAGRVVKGITSHDITFSTNTHVGLPNRRGGYRVYAEVNSSAENDHDSYSSFMAVQKSKDAGRI